MKDIYNNYNSTLFFKNIKQYLKVYNFKMKKLFKKIHSFHFIVLFIT